MFFTSKNHHFVYKHYVSILILTLIISSIGGYFAAKLPLESDLAELLPDSFASVKALRDIQEQVGGVGNLRIILESSDYDALTRLADTLAVKLADDRYINYVDHTNDVDFYQKNALLFLELSELDSLHRAIENKIDEEKQQLNPLFVDDLFGDNADAGNDENSLEEWEEKYQDMEPTKYYTNHDSTVLVIRVYPSASNTSLSFVEKMFEHTKSTVANVQPESYAEDMKVYYGGNFKNRLDEYEVVSNDILGTALYGLSGVFLLIIIYFRRLTAAILISLTLFCSLAWTFGVTYFVIGSLNTITGFLFVILFGLGIDYGIHAFARYTESRKSGLSFEASMEKMVCQTGRALTTTAVTTSAAFFSLMLMDFKGFSELGFISGVGILFALIAMTMVLPAFITLFEKWGLLKIKPVVAKSEAFERRSLQFVRPVLLISGLLTILGAYGVFQVGFEYDFTNLRAISEERELVDQKTKGVFKLGESPTIALVDSKEEIDEVVAALEQKMASDTVSPTIENVRTIYSLVPENQPERLAKIREIRELVNDEAEGVIKGEDKERLDRLQEYLQVDEPFTWDEFPQKDKRQFITKQGDIGNFIFIYPSVPLRDGQNAIAFRDDVGTIETASGKVYHASSSNIVMAEMLTIMISEGRIAVLLAFFVVFMLVLFDFRSIKAALFVLMPLALGILWMVGMMFLFGWKWNLFNIVVLPSVIGIGVDNGVHIYHRYQEEGTGSLIHVLKNTGVAITMTTLTTIVGYSGLIMAHHPGLNSIGDLAVVGLLSTYLTAVLVLPAAIQFFENRKLRKAHAE